MQEYLWRSCVEPCLADRVSGAEWGILPLKAASVWQLCGGGCWGGLCQRACWGSASFDGWIISWVIANRSVPQQESSTFSSWMALLAHQMVECIYFSKEASVPLWFLIEEHAKISPEWCPSELSIQFLQGLWVLCVCMYVCISNAKQRHHLTFWWPEEQQWLCLLHGAFSNFSHCNLPLVWTCTVKFRTLLIPARCKWNASSPGRVNVVMGLLAGKLSLTSSSQILYLSLWLMQPSYQCFETVGTIVVRLLSGSDQLKPFSFSEDNLYKEK